MTRLAPAAALQASRVAIIVLNWNRAKDTLDCLESLLPAVHEGIASVICCDNGSTDDSVQTIESWARQHFIAIPSGPASGITFARPLTEGATIPAFTLLQTGANLGYAGGNNVGIRYALEWGMVDYIWILNNDTVITQNALSTLIGTADGLPDVAAFGSTIVDYYHPTRVQCAGGCRYFPVLSVIKNALGGRDLQDVLKHRCDVRLDYVTGAALFLRTAAVRKVGLLNESFFLYYEEADYAKRLRKKDYLIAWCKESIVLHKGGVSTQSRSAHNSRGSWISEYHENLSTIKYTAEHHPMLLPVTTLFRLVAKTFLIFLFRRWQLFPPLIKAYWDFILSRRRPQKHSRALTPPRVLFLGTPRLNSGSDACY